ncbi:enhancer of mRNA-decapping protein 4 homolog [Lucilia sericata]|uniref:enhancer of mRNA-decapping protein 4 homolog n=1 Tax=Lucilia sericata TaxID=13632 RepID=UPI0018A83DDE|nr:enhancer of mRNA-decapping protein 4 homolog [Lucilia sericata]
MLVALLTVDAVLKKSLLRSFQRRGNSLESSQASIANPSIILTTNQQPQLSPIIKSKVKVSFRLFNKQIMSTIGQQIPAAGVVPLPSNTMAENTDNIINNNTKIISFKSGDKQCCQEIKSKHVKIIANPGTHDHGSSKVKLKNIVDYIWEVKNYPGHLIAVHIDEKYIAYAINVNNKVSRMEGMVRVVNTAKGLRALIKGMSGEVLDLQFAHIEKEHILASIDANSLYVHQIVLQEGTLVCNLILKIEDPLTNYTPKYDKISWCPFIELPGEDDDDSQLIVWARGSLFQCFNVNIVVADQGMGKCQASDIKSGYLRHYDETKTITWVALSPDGSTLGVGSTDGVIRFYQVYIHDKDPRCLHEWKPYNDKPVSSFFFLDNLTKNNSDTYWKFAITGADNNTEFKVWDCGTWNCLQTINFSCSIEKPLRFIAELDRTSSYLVVSSLETRTCYVMQIINTSSCYPAIKEETSDSEEVVNKDNSGSTVASSSTSQMTTPAVVYIKSISEFPLSSGILSFSIVDAAVRRYKCSNDNYMCEELDDYDEETSSIYCVVVHMYVVQAKSMQECHILYQPSVPENSDVKSTMSSSDTSAVSRNNISNKALASNASENNERTDDDDDVEVIRNESEVEELTRNIPLIKDEFSGNKQNALELLLDIASSSNVSSTANIASSSAGSTVVAVAAAAAAAPSVIATENNADSRNPSPKVSTSNKNYPQLNLMTPDAFTSTSSSNNERKTPENVSSEVLNTILMLAGVAGQNAAPVKPENINLLNLVNNKIIEDKEQQKMQLKHHNLESQKNFMAIDRNPGRNIGENLASGGSSPSREVQEIMSLQEYDKSSYSGDELLEENNENATETDATGTDDINVTASDPTNTKLAQTTTTTTNWPKVPDVPKVSNNKHSAELQNAANLISQAVNASSMSNLSNSHLAPTLGNTSNNSSNNNNNNNIAANNMNNVANDLSDINGKISELIDLVKMQSIQINSLQNEVSELKKANGNFKPKNMSEFGYKLEMQLSKLMEKYLIRYETEHNRKLSSFLAGKDVQNRELRDSIMQIMNQYVLTQFGEMVSKVMTLEIQRQLAPMLAAKLDNMQQQIQLNVAQKLSAFDLMIKENIAQACKSKTIIDTFGKSVLVGVQGSLQAAFVESMSSTLIPAYEKSSQNMFKQLHEAFSVGIKEFMEQFDNYLQQLQPMHDSTEEILNKFSGFRQHLDSILTKHRNGVQDVMLETRKDIKGLELLLSRQIQETIRSEVRKSFENQVAAIRSQANTPAPMYGVKDTIRHLLLQGQINKAFHQALLANDLSLVEFTLKSADHNAVFTPDCCLEQKVLLSLIQQISADMSDHNELKQNYLAEALLAINPMDPITREHAPKVLQELFRNCQMFLINYPKSSQCSNVRMLMKAVQAYKDQF